MPRPSDLWKDHPDPAVQRGRERLRGEPDHDVARCEHCTAPSPTRYCSDECRRADKTGTGPRPNRAQRRGTRKADYTLRFIRGEEGNVQVKVGASGTSLSKRSR